jgi:hypothetical protein
VEKNGYDLVTVCSFFDFVHCLNFLTNTTFRNSGLCMSSVKEARNLMDFLDQAISQALVKICA